MPIRSHYASSTTGPTATRCARGEGQRVRARARPGGQVRRHAFGQCRHVAESRRDPRRRRTAARSARSRVRDGRRRRQAAGARGGTLRRGDSTTCGSFPYQPKAQLDDSFATADVFIVSLKPGIAGYIVPSKVYGILAAGRPVRRRRGSDCEVAEIAREHDCGVLAAPGDAGIWPRRSGALRRPAGDGRHGERARDAAWLYDRRPAVKAYYALCARVADVSGVPHEARV